ncbi:peptidase domain-containing ABC transporter [Flavobacterium sp.]|uniref:peptidase domain-containing ABC transporter n=1 Tax=Flavobacterium sp. TaxID=239 RepID=UPI0031DDC28A
MKKFPNYIQADSKDCGATCIKIIARYYGKTIHIQDLRTYSETSREGSNLLLLGDAAEKIGFRTLGAKLSCEKLEEVPLPCILHWNKLHFVVLYKIKKRKYYISDPGFGLLEYDEEQFLKSWIGNNAERSTEEGIGLLIEPTPNFMDSKDDIGSQESKFGFSLLFKYIIPYRHFLLQLAIGLAATSLLQLLFPFLTQSIVDVGIQNQNIHFVYLILFAQLFLFVGKTALDLIRSWIMLHMSARINISLISDFFIKLMNLPISFFDVRMTGDIMQRINDHHRIESLLTSSSLTVLFSAINMIIMGGVLAYYNVEIFCVFFLGSGLYFLWIILFLKRRAVLDYKRFAEVSQEQSKVIELISGMQEIKLHNAEKKKRWGWEFIQARLFKVSIKNLALEQAQILGSNFINEIKNIVIVFLSAKFVIDGQITLGMMLAISSIVGSLNGPVVQIIAFVREMQDAKISLARLSEIHEKEDECQQEDNQIHELPGEFDILINNLSFRYAGSHDFVLSGLNLMIPANKVTAIVGTSGSGKTTLMKLLLKFYDLERGAVTLMAKDQKQDNATVDLKNIAQKTWRNAIGTVMQEGFIFNDTIANNIAVGSEIIDKEKLKYAADVANISGYISGLPLGYNTKIGAEGQGMSTGQKQRLLIARAVYKNPEILFFDEATSALDTSNERKIMENLGVFFENRTVVIIAHRLSTVIKADKIVVLDKGQIIEVGTHQELVKFKGSYYELVRNQLNLGA